MFEIPPIILNLIRYPLLLCLGYCATPRRRRTIAQQQIERRCRRRREYAPVPLSTSRKRALTLQLPSPKGNGALKQRTRDQSQSIFFARLPLDVRLMIYKDAIGGHDIHIIRLNRRLGHVVCWQPDRKNPWKHKCLGRTHDDGFYIEPLEGSPAPPKIISLIKACRQIYTEAIHMLYAHNTFLVDHLDTVVNLSCTIFPQRLASIRSLQLTWTFHHLCLESRFQLLPPDDGATWEQACQIIASMKGLRSFRLTMDEASVYLAAVLLEPLKSVRERDMLDLRSVHSGKTEWLSNRLEISRP